MHDHTSQEHAPTSAPVGEPRGPETNPDPVAEYRLLAHELQACYPEADAQDLDLLIARVMAVDAGYSVEAIRQALLAASLALASGTISNAQDYVEGTVNEAIQADPTQDTGLGWG